MVKFLKTVGIHTVSRGDRCEHFLNKCFQSILNQDYSEISKWVVGDGSCSAAESTVLRAWFTSQFGAPDNSDTAEPAEGGEAPDNSDAAEPAEGGEAPEHQTEPPLRWVVAATGLTVVLLPYTGNSWAAVAQEVNASLTDVDVVVHFDDDDLYVERRVSWAVKQLRHYQIVGSKDMWVWDCLLGQFICFSAGHGGNNRLKLFSAAYTQDYAQTHSLSAGTVDFLPAATQEEDGVGLLEPWQVGVWVLHARNTLDLRRMVRSSILSAPHGHMTDPRDPTWPWKIQTGGRGAMDRAFQTEAKSTPASGPVGPPPDQAAVADVVFLCGSSGHQPWDPAADNLFAWQNELVAAAGQLARAGSTVEVFGHFDPAVLAAAVAAAPAGAEPGPVYRSELDFDYTLEYKCLVLSGLQGTLLGLRTHTRAQQLVVHPHSDHLPGLSRELFEHWERVDKLVVASPHHLDLLMSDSIWETSRAGDRDQPGEEEVVQGDTPTTDGLPIWAALTEPANIFRERALVVPRTILPEFRPHARAAPAGQREPYHFLFCGRYTRGLVPLLIWAWPHVFNRDPRAELHVYGGLDERVPKDARHLIFKLLAQPGVMDHGRQPRAEVARAKSRAAYHVYVPGIRADVDTFSLQESVNLGCVPIFIPHGVFATFCGEAFLPGDSLKEQDVYQKLGEFMLELIKKGSNHLKNRQSSISVFEDDRSCPAPGNLSWTTAICPSRSAAEPEQPDSEQPAVPTCPA